MTCSWWMSPIGAPETSQLSLSVGFQDVSSIMLALQMNGRRSKKPVIVYFRQRKEDRTPFSSKGLWIPVFLNTVHKMSHWCFSSRLLWRKRYRVKVGKKGFYLVPLIEWPNPKAPTTAVKAGIEQLLLFSSEKNRCQCVLLKNTAKKIFDRILGAITLDKF